MTQLNRRRFLKVAGIGGAVAAGSAIPVVEQLFADRAKPVAFRAVAGVPAAPLASYASYVLDGYVDLGQRKGTVTRTVLAGHPGAASAIALPGLSQTVQITDVRHEAGLLRLRGSIADRSQLAAHESADIEITIDRKGGLVWSRSGESLLTLTLER